MGKIMTMTGKVQKNAITNFQLNLKQNNFKIYFSEGKKWQWLEKFKNAMTLNFQLNQNLLMRTRQ